jgi:CheY-specific phosphatase CheX
MLEDARHAAISAVRKVFETMFFIFPDLQEGNRGSGPQLFQDAHDSLRGEIGFNGKAAGTLRLYLPFSLAEAMASNFMGCEEEPPSESQVKDTVNEICNMICGNLVSQWDKKTVWNVSLPRTGPISSLEAEKEWKTSEIILDFMAEEQGLRLAVQLET